MFAEVWECSNQQDWKEQHAFDYVKAAGGQIKVQQACQRVEVEAGQDLHILTIRF